MKFRKTMVAGTTIALAGVLAACGSNSASSKGTSITRMESDVISTMDPSTSTDAISGQALIDTMDGLYRYSGKDLKPAIAKSQPTVSNDGKTYTFKLRNAKWSNGDPVTAQDFVFGWRRTVAPKTKSEYAYLFSGVKNADDITAGKKATSTLGVTAVNKTTLKVTLDHAIPYFKTMLVNPAFFPQNEKFVNKAGKKFGTTAKYALSNGPYVLKNWNGTGNTWKETKNKTYWNAKNVHIDTLNGQVIKDPQTALNLYQSKKLDIAQLSGEQAAKAKTMADYKGLNQSAIFYLELNEKKVPIFKNAKIRQAVSAAINRSEYIKKVLNDSSIAAKNVTPEGLFIKGGQDFSKVASKADGSATKYDPAKAKKLWTEGLKETGQSAPTLELTADDTTQGKRSAEYLQSTLEQNLPGLKVTIASVPFKTRLSRAQNGQFDMIYSGWSADFPDAISFLDLFTSDNSYNDGKWSNSEYDALIKQSKTTDANNPTARWNTLLKAQEILTKEQGVVPLYQRVQATLQRKTITGLKYNPTSSYDFVNAKVK
ncbi:MULTISPECIES: peptide ABC transporter substrate-binding protein [Lacticaseibacillus]|uniref:Peptide ABC transporter substrate-binding protein n=2 Tax=Lacticaseibacillus TaxID=2759736 RepID=A0AAN1EZK5_LACCA|nr:MULTISPECIES: peptide ABC transporter substrate-binding protein [Lacticaseibacillus]ARY92027.1 peptide ABC transporter substrate-binding protein [Lacticaseibacillus casei]KAB1971076.1 peptide ABC transporter substrate-binding protein [Lacticaseibacillus casei]WLV79929.1 peptide ABC transporter substrate-binding protein [Lacticaseibacillus sp. NCIMB 15473]WNX23889.1 peptide ABC transporter substrate-binding protein [Lacticaseibacillus casei]WNX26664.1 peptide ABC transporter substrate-bindin